MLRKERPLSWQSGCCRASQSADTGLWHSLEAALAGVEARLRLVGCFTEILNAPRRAEAGGGALTEMVEEFVPIDSPHAHWTDLGGGDDAGRKAASPEHQRGQGKIDRGSDSCRIGFYPLGEPKAGLRSERHRHQVTVSVTVLDVVTFFTAICSVPR